MNRVKKNIFAFAWPLLGIFVLGMASAEIYNYTSADRPLAFVRRFKPDVVLFPQEITAEKGQPIYDGDTLRTNEEGYAAVQFMDKSFAKVKPNSELIVRGEVSSDKSTSTRIALEAGEIFMEVTQRADNNFEVATSKSVASVKGTVFGVSADDEAWVIEGVVEFLASISGESVTLTDGMLARVTEDNTITTRQLTTDEMQNLQDDYDAYESETGEPQQLQLQFRDENGNLQQIDIEYHENNEDNESNNDN